MLKNFGLGPKTLTNFYRCSIESILSGCISNPVGMYSNCTIDHRNALQRMVRSVYLVSQEGQNHQDLSHPSHGLFTLLPSKRQTQ